MRLTLDRKWLIRIFIFLFLAVLSILAFFAYKFFSFYQKIYEDKPLSVQIKKKKPEKKIYNILLLGYGGPGHDGAFLTDTIILAHIDKEKRQVVLISIPRDLWVKVPHKRYGFIRSKINALYQMLLFPENYPFLPDEYKDKSPAFLLSQRVEEITGYKPDYFLAIDFQGFVKIVDLLGGIEVELDKFILDERYPAEGKADDLCGWRQEDLATMEALIQEKPEEVFPCRYERFYLPAGVNKLDGKTALKLVRSRKGINSGGDFGRAERQQKVIQAVVKKALQIGIIPKIPALLDELSENLRTDIPLKVIKENLDELYRIDEYKIFNIVLSSENILSERLDPEGGYILYPAAGLDAWDQVREFIRKDLESQASAEAELESATKSSEVDKKKQ